MRIEPEQVTRTAAQLLLVGGLLAIILSPTLFLLQTPIERIELGSLTGVVISAVLGIVLIVAARQVHESPLTTILLSFVAAIALLALGGTAGLIGGLFGIVGALVGSAPLVRDLVTLEG